MDQKHGMHVFNAAIGDTQQVLSESRSRGEVRDQEKMVPLVMEPSSAEALLVQC